MTSVSWKWRSLSGYRKPSSMSSPSSPTKILIYQTLISYLKAACSARVSGQSHNQIVKLHRVLDGYLISMSSGSVVDAVVNSLGCRRTLLELASELGLTNDPDLRHSLRADEGGLVTHITSIFDSKAAEHDVLSLEGDAAQCFLNVIQDALDRGFLMPQERKAHRIVRKLCEACDKLPSSLFITGVSDRGEHPTFGGGFANVYRASYDNKAVALKVVRYFLTGSELRELRLKLGREALVWKELHHPYILAFIGIDQDSFPSTLGMVSPWMEHGTVLNYLNVHGRSTVDKLLFEIAQGLQYLHSRNIVHGDLRGANILISEAWTACLADFGLSALADTTSTLRSTNRSGSLYWMAPELIDPDRFHCKFLRTPATDVYAFGCVCVELYTGLPPFSEVTEVAAMLKIIAGERAQRPTGAPVMSDTLWQCVTEFWAGDPLTRPSSKVVVQNMIWPALEADTEEKGSLYSPKSPQNSEFGPSAYATPASKDDPNDIVSTKGEDIVGESGWNREGSPPDSESAYARSSLAKLWRLPRLSKRFSSSQYSQSHSPTKSSSSPLVDVTSLKSSGEAGTGQTHGKTVATFEKHRPMPRKNNPFTASTKGEGVDGSLRYKESPAPPDNELQAHASGASKDTLNASLRDAIHRQARMADSILPLVESGADVNIVVVNSTRDRYTTALQLASSQPNKTFVAKLLNHGADPNLCDGDYGTALRVASMWGHVENVKELLAKGANPNINGTYGTALQAASFEGHIKVVQLLVEKGADINASGGTRGTALQCASARGHMEVVQLLVEKGADINAGGPFCTALQAASTNGFIEIVQLLVKKGADVNAQATSEQGTALCAASYWGHIEIVQLLVERGADINAPGGPKGTALQAASLKGYIKIVQLLVEKGADIHAQGPHGPARWAASNHEVVDYLRRRGAT